MENERSSASHHALLFAFLAKEAVEKFGQEGEAAVTAGVRRYGEQRGYRMAQRTLADGGTLNVENYLLYGEWEARPGEVDLRFPSYPPEVRMQGYRCPWNDEWRRRGLEKYGCYYCREVDAALARGYNNLELKLLENRTMGGKCCDFIFIGCAVPPERMEAFECKRKMLGGKARMPWDYHIGHLYRTMSEAIVSAFGSEGEACVLRALESYRQEYGDAAAEMVLRYKSVDYDMLPPYAGIESRF